MAARKKKDDQQSVATQDKRDIFAFVRGNKPNDDSPEKKQYWVAILAEDGVMLHEFNALTANGCLAFTRSENPDKSMDAAFTKHFPAGWKIHWINNPSENKKLKTASTTYKANLKKAKEEASGQSNPSTVENSAGSGQGAKSEAAGSPGSQAGGEGTPGAESGVDQEVAAGGESITADGATTVANHDGDTTTSEVDQKSDDQIEVVHIDLNVDLSTGAKAAILDQLMELQIEEAVVEAKRKKAVDKAKLDLAAVDKERADLCAQYRGGDKVSTPCVVERDSDNNITQVLRQGNDALVADEDWQPVLGLNNAKETPEEPGLGKELCVCLCDGNVELQEWSEDGWQGTKVGELHEGSVFRMRGALGEIVTSGILLTDTPSGLREDTTEHPEVTGIFKSLGIAVWKADLKMHTVAAINWALENTAPEGA